MRPGISLVPTPRRLSVVGPSLPFSGVVADVEPGCDGAAAALDAFGSEDGGQPRPGRAPLRVTVGTDPDDAARRRTDVADLRAEGYILNVSGTAQAPRAVIAAADEAGAYYGVQTLIQLVESAGDMLHVPRVEVWDWPFLPWRGTIEGFYGPPWSHADRLAHLEFAGRHKLNTYVYAPKDDPYHRAEWRTPYPDDELARLAELVDTARRHHVRFVFTVSPGLSMVYSDAAELETLLAKLDQVWRIGVRDIGLLFDDIEPDLAHELDRERFGTTPGSSARAHAAVCWHVRDHFLAPRGAEQPLLMVPTDYAGTKRSPYRDHLAAELPEDVLVWWTGRDIVVGDVTREHVDAAAASYGHRLLLWDNFPVNDFDFSRLFLGPLLGRTSHLDTSTLAGITANPMPQAAASEIALATVADWAWNPGAYQPEASHRKVRAALRGGAGLERLIDACRTWPPSASRDPELAVLVTEALDGRPDDALERLRSAFTAMTRPPQPRTERSTRLVREVQPWLQAQAVLGRAGLAALEYLMEPSAARRDAAERALADARAQEKDVLKPIIVPFLESALDAN